MTEPGSSDPALDGDGMYALCAELFPLPRSITGDGVRATLAAVGRHLPLEVHEVPSGTAVLDWTVPPEWRVREAWIADERGNRVVDVAQSPLRLLGYSRAVETSLSLEELRPHLFTLPDRPSYVPYLTSYYAPNWGFCLSHDEAEALPPGQYQVVIDADLDPDGSLTYGELLLPGDSEDEVLVSTHVCHPSLANDNLSGIAVATALAQHVGHLADRRLTYRFVFVPGTIGSITWLARNREAATRVRHGVVLTGLGDAGGFTYKRSRRSDAYIDRVIPHVLRERGERHSVVDFSPYGYDERQYCSPGFDLPVGRLSRTPHGEYPEYHTSADDLGFISPGSMAAAVAVLREVMGVLEGDRRYRNLAPYGEPQLGRRGLYRDLGASNDKAAVEQAYLWLLSCSDGRHSLLDIAARSGLAFQTLRTAAEALQSAQLLGEAPEAA